MPDQILVEIVHFDNDLYPSYGSNPHTVNQLGQESFALNITPRIANIGSEQFVGPVLIRQELTDATEAVVSTVEKLVNVTIQSGESREIIGPFAGALPLKDVNTSNREFVHETIVSKEGEILSRVITTFRINETDVYLESAPVAGKSLRERAEAELARVEKDIIDLAAAVTTVQGDLKAAQDEAAQLRKFLNP